MRRAAAQYSRCVIDLAESSTLVNTDYDKELTAALLDERMLA
jgi:hypothetical protein